jgi:prepilin-type N-terminal cleavage/methylation domain-containing protein
LAVGRWPLVSNSAFTSIAYSNLSFRAFNSPFLKRGVGLARRGICFFINLGSKNTPSAFRGHPFTSKGEFNNKAFTLIELLVVVLIIGILAAIALPKYRKAVERTRLTEVTATMNELSKSLNLYLLTNGIPNAPVGYGDTLNLLDITFPNRSGAYIKVGNYRIYANLSNISGGWWIHVDNTTDFSSGGSIIRWQADGQRTCNDSSDFASLCQYLKSQGLAK